MKKLPVSMSSFRELVEKDLVYADKTRSVHEMVTGGKFNFLARPRRFGKTLLLSAVEALFGEPPPPLYPGYPPRKGPRELFSGLWIGSSGYEYETHPVVSVSMARASSSPETLKLDIVEYLAHIASGHGLDMDASRPGAALASLVKGLRQKFGRQVVLLIDEYDAPASVNFDRPLLAEGNRSVLRDFYAGVMDSDEHLRLVLLIGVTSLAMSGLAPALSGIEDLTLDPRFSGSCGFTAGDLDGNFGEHMADALRTMTERGGMPAGSTADDLRELILDWYGGYSWDGTTRVMNPCSTVQLFDQATFSDYWNPASCFGPALGDVSDGDLLSLVNDGFRDLPKRALCPDGKGAAGPAPALFQSGYLTVDEVSPGPDGPLYTLRIPNREVWLIRDGSFSRLLYSLLGRSPQDVSRELKGALRRLDSGALTGLFASFFGSFPAGRLRDDESCYRNIARGFLGGLHTPKVMPLSHGAAGAPGLAVFYPDERLYAAVEIRCPGDWQADGKEDLDGKVRLSLAREAVRAAGEKEHVLPFAAQVDRVVIVGLGVVWSGRCLALAEEGDPARIRPAGA
ncbi:MAG: AAA family ATPase [Deltaproteobacteria bacterium]|nr:AAA family ATPase [Deltaproteobacteria bacterium]